MGLFVVSNKLIIIHANGVILINLYSHIQSQKKCKKSCQILQYEGKVVVDKPYSWGEKNWASFAYEIDPPERLTVYQEYVVYDAIGIIGSVGGTLGLFIGFSFSGLISRLVDFCSKLFKSDKGHFSNEVTKVAPIENYKNDFRTVQQYQIVIERLEVLEKFMNKFDRC